MKFLFIANTSWYIYNFRKNLILYLLKMGHNINVISPKDQYSGELTKLGINYIEVEFDRKNKNPLKELKLVHSFRKQIKSIKPDIIHLFTIKPVIYGAITARICRVNRIICSIPGLGFIFSKKNFSQFPIKLLYKIALKSHKIITIFQNPDDQSFFKKNKLIHKNNSHLIFGSGIDTYTFKSMYQRNNEKIKFGLFSRMIKEKGIIEYINAAKSIKKQYENCEYILAGDIDPGNPNSLTKLELEKHCNGVVV